MSSLHSYLYYNINANPAVKEDNTIARIIIYMTNFNLFSRFDFLVGAFFLFFAAKVKTSLDPYAICILPLK